MTHGTWPRRDEWHQDVAIIHPRQDPPQTSVKMTEYLGDLSDQWLGVFGGSGMGSK